MNKGNSFGVLAILLLLELGYLIPTVILAVEDKGLMQEEKAIAIDEIELNPQRVDIIEQLSVFSEMMFSRIIIQMDKENESAQESLMQSENSTEQRKDESNLNQCIQEFWMSLKGKEELRFEKFVVQNYIMMAGISSDNLYSIWECIGVDKNGYEYNFWIDDATGKIVGFDIPYSCVASEEEAFYSAMNGLSEYYGFSSYGFADSFPVSKTKYWENGLILYNENIDVRLNLGIYRSGDRLLFNIYPNSKSISE